MKIAVSKPNIGWLLLALLLGWAIGWAAGRYQAQIAVAGACAKAGQFTVEERTYGCEAL